MTKDKIVSGMRPTGPLHLGHYFGVLRNWINFQNEYECYFFVADWHALTSEYNNPQKIKTFITELIKDWFSVGLNPEKCIIFLQSQVKQHAELHLILSMLTPLGWLERNPTYKEVKQELVAKDLNTYGFLGYPVLMASDILIYRPQYVPVGDDQLPHLELTREIARRFNFLYGNTFPEPQAKLTEASRLPGLDGRKMSKSYGNAILLNEDMNSVQKKIMSMLTDTNRKRKTDPGDPNKCNLYPYHKLLTPKEIREEIKLNCTQAKWGCVDCKKILLTNLEKFLIPIHEKRKQIDKDKSLVEEILNKGNKKAQEEAEKTMLLVRKNLNFF
ncbi:tryptophanyl-tRNA synthetase [Desulfonauticus submarinus]|uniref:Tryptophan--tRNA ligase n=1 Tax=Desulfonauticus submarinus TaxID=206665 RepID=A0A1H0A519_9BACT|nr:tryptophan--tRNA ligase [Desulfonauticus submarinus]SDN28749.1 tryptophanyl-tRNA synthetase [Desulfonauticus submarinus]